MRYLNMLNHAHVLSATLDQAIDRASMGLDFLIQNKVHQKNENALLAHIEMLENKIKGITNQYNELVAEANAHIDDVTSKHNELANKYNNVCAQMKAKDIELNNKQIELEEERINNFDLLVQNRSYNNLNRAYSHAVGQLEKDQQQLVNIGVRRFIFNSTNKNNIQKINF